MKIGGRYRRPEPGIALIDVDHNPVIRKFLFLPLLVLGSAPASAQSNHTFTTNNGAFQLDGKPFQIIGTALHPARIPRIEPIDVLRTVRPMFTNAPSISIDQLAACPYTACI